MKHIHISKAARNYIREDKASYEELEKDLLKHDNKFRYMMLNRMQMDCNYFLGNGHAHEKHLWADNVEEQIKLMKALYNSLPEKPEWLTMEQIDDYEKRMLEALEKNEDVNTLCDKVDSVEKDLEDMVKMVTPKVIMRKDICESLIKLIEQALEIGDEVTVVNSGVIPRKGTVTNIKGDVATVDFPAVDGTPARTDQYYTDELKKSEKIYCVDVFLDTVDGDPKPELTEFTKESLIDYLNDFGYELDMDCSDDELKEACKDLEQPIKFIRESFK